jgi:hypothetical protein
MWRHASKRAWTSSPAQRRREALGLLDTERRVTGGLRLVTWCRSGWPVSSKRAGNRVCSGAGWPRFESTKPAAPCLCCSRWHFSPRSVRVGRDRRPLTLSNASHRRRRPSGGRSRCAARATLPLNIGALLPLPVRNRRELATNTRCETRFSAPLLLTARDHAAPRRHRRRRAAPGADRGRGHSSLGGPVG